MDLPALKSIASDWLIPDLLSVVFEYARPSKHLWFLSDDDRTAVAHNKKIRIFSRHPIGLPKQSWTVTIVSNSTSDVRIGIASYSDDRSYSVNFGRVYGYGFFHLFDDYGPSVNHRPIYDPTIVWTVAAVITKTDFDRKRPPTLTNRNYGRHPDELPVSETIQSLSTIRFFVNGVDCGAFRNVPNVEKLQPYAQMRNAKVTFD